MFFFVDTAELGERKADLYIFKCENYHKVEIFDMDDILTDKEYEKL